MAENHHAPPPPPLSDLYDHWKSHHLINAATVNENPTLPETLYDFPHESELNRRYRLSPPPPTSDIHAISPVHGGGGGGSILRMRVQSAARGQNMGSYMQPQDYAVNLDLLSVNGVSDYNLGIGNNNRRRFTEYNYVNSRMRNYTTMLSSAYGIHEPSKFSLMLQCLRGNNILLMAKDQYGRQFLQRKLEEGSPAEIELIFAEIKDHVGELMMDQSGSYFVKKLFEVCNQEQMTVLLLLVIGDELNLVPICLDNHGSRAMLKLLEHLRTREQRSLLMSVLRRIVVPLTRNTNGHNVIQHCFKLFPTEDNKHILNVVAENCLSIATDKNGCCILQQCLAHSHGQARDCLMAKITANALVLSQDPYGNYVVQYIVGLKMPHVAAKLVAKLAGNYVLLSINKYGSNVVEKCLRELDHHLSLPIVEEIINSPYFLMVLQDPYGNYVAQSALKICKGETRHKMINHINDYYAFLHSHPYGKRVLARTKWSKQCV
ncbi:UNVERIFIED_CONTAM: Pumilio9 [Sesamum calycinum]|uniref:Pumilio9 n=1 Tax=Sesamum calycinum TaxID=2727403 RepID=A0AAW2R7Z6_9LAMI